MSGIRIGGLFIALKINVGAFVKAMLRADRALAKVHARVMRDGCKDALLYVDRDKAVAQNMDAIKAMVRPGNAKITTIQLRTTDERIRELKRRLERLGADFMTHAHHFPGCTDTDCTCGLISIYRDIDRDGTL